MSKMTVKRYFQLMAVYAKMDLASLMRDTRYMLIAITADVISNISAISGLFLLAWKLGGIGGMNRYEILFMLAYANIVNGFLFMMGCCNNSLNISRVIGRGQWEHMFIMPLSYPVQLTIGVLPFTGTSNLLTGIVMLIVAICNLPPLPFWWLPLLLGNMILSMIIIVSLSYAFSSLAFYAPVQCEEISTTVLSGLERTSSFPLAEMPAYVKYPLLTILPSGLLSWFPTLIILGHKPAQATIYPLLIAIVFSTIAVYTFKKGFRYYVQKGINRYSAGGHRS